MECTRTVNKVYAMKHGLLLHQRMSVRQARGPEIRRPTQEAEGLPRGPKLRVYLRKGKGLKKRALKRART